MSDHPSSTNPTAGHVPDTGHTRSRPIRRGHAAARGRAVAAVVATGAVGGFVGYFIGGGGSSDMSTSSKTVSDRPSTSRSPGPSTAAPSNQGVLGGFDDPGTGGPYRGGFHQGSYGRGGFDDNPGSVSNGAVPGPTSGSVQGPSTSTRGS